MARRVTVEGASQNNLRDVSVTFEPGLTALVGVSGSGKSSLAFDTVYGEARRRFLDTLSLGSPWLRMRPARVRRIDGLGPAVAIEQNTLNRNPLSTVATSTGIHPFLRILFSRFGDVTCVRCSTPVRAMSDEERVAAVVSVLPCTLEVPLVRQVAGSHTRLLDMLASGFGKRALVVDGARWDGRPLDSQSPHDVTLRRSRIDDAKNVRDALADADALGSAVLLARPQKGPAVALLRSPVCPGCDAWVPPLEPTAFRDGTIRSHRVAGRTIGDVLASDVAAAASFASGLDLGPRSARVVGELVRRLDALVSLNLGHLTLDRSMPTLSRGESQRVRLAVVLANRLEDLLHVLDEPTIGLHHRDVAQVMRAIDGLRGPVLMVEHDAAAIAHADDVVELGPHAGPAGGRVEFQGAPAALWKADTVSGLAFSGRERAAPRAQRDAPSEFVTIEHAEARNLTGVDCRFPVGRLTAVTGPSGAGKTTLVRDVMLSSLRSGEAAGCRSLHGPELRAVEVDQSPLGNNPRSNPATYTKVLDRIRTVFARETGLDASAFSFNRPEGACPGCEGMGAVEVKLRYLYSSWVPCAACEGLRYKPEVLEARLGDLSIADVLAMDVDGAHELFAEDKTATRIFDALVDVGLGYLALGQPSPSLSGGEAQRVRLARELARAKRGDLVVLDEPTTGLHPADLDRLLAVFDGLIARGCTVVVVEHQQDVIAAADWIVDLGPGGGPSGGRLISEGPPKKGRGRSPKPRAQARRRSRASDAIKIRGASANNLRDVSVDIPKGQLTVVTGVSGSGKSSLIRDVLEAEATRRLLECLSMYERQSTREGPEAPVRSITGLGPTLMLGQERRIWDRRATVGTASELSTLVAVLLARTGTRPCASCGEPMKRRTPAAGESWTCKACGATAPPLEPRHFSPTTYAAACLGCGGVGTLQEPVVERLVVKPDEPICGGALHSPGYYPRNYLCTPGTGGHRMLTAVAKRHGFDPRWTPWRDISEAARHAFLFGDDEPYTGLHKHAPDRPFRWKGVYTELTHWDVGGMYTRTVACTSCGGGKLREEYLAVRLDGWNREDVHSATLHALDDHLERLRTSDEPTRHALDTARRRLRFLGLVGLGYVHLDRSAATLSAGEAQRIRLASILGGQLTGITVLLDEPTRGLHPSEVGALADVLRELRDAGNTIVVVEHDEAVTNAADHVIDVGPGPGSRGGRIVRTGPPQSDADGHRAARERRGPQHWMTVRGARENNLSGDDIRIPLGVLCGVCGLSGSGKSTLVVDTIGRALAPPKLTTSVAYERYDPGAHDAIDGAPERTVVCDQTRRGINSAGGYLGLVPVLRTRFLASDAASSDGVTEIVMCDACAGGWLSESMGFLPSVAHTCEACDGTGYARESRLLESRGHTLPAMEAMQLDELLEVWPDDERIARSCRTAVRLGLGYLVVRQPGWSLSGGEAQRLKLTRELAKKTVKPTLYLLDEPTAGLHRTDIDSLVTALDVVVDAGHSVLCVEHEPALLSACDWVVELGPGGGPDGGRVVAEGTPETISAGDTPIAQWLR